MNINRKIISALIALCVMFSILPAAALADETSGKCGDNLTWEYISSLNRLVISGSGDMYDYDYFSPPPWDSFKSSISYVQIGKNVTSIGAHAFSGLNKLTVLNASDSSLTKISENSFYFCSKLSVAALPQSLSEIGAYAFQSCSALYSIAFPNSLEKIGAYAFFGCKSIESVKIAQNVCEIGYLAFGSCTSLSSFEVSGQNKFFSSDADGRLYNADKTEILRCPPALSAESFTLPDTVTVIGSGAFEGCGSLKSIEFSPDNVKEIKGRAFQGCGFTEAVIYADISYSGDVYWNCKQLADVTIEDGPEYINTGFFAGCSALTEIKIPDSVQSIRATAFSRCSSLKNIDFGNGVKSIDEWAFQNCTQLEELVIPDNVENLYSNAFKNCTMLSSVYIGSGIKKLTTNVFEGDSALERITVSENNTSYSSDEYGILYNKDKTELVLFPIACTLEEYTLTPTTLVISAEAFSKNNNIKKINLNDGLKTINRRAFYGCAQLETIQIPNSVEEVGPEILVNTAYFKNNLTDGCVYSGDWLLDISSDITSITIAEGIKALADSCCSSYKLKSVYIPSSVEKLGQNAMSSTALEKITVSPDNAVFSSDENGILYSKDRKTLLLYPRSRQVTEFAVPEVEKIAPEAFKSVKNLTKIVLPETVKEIGSDAFSSCNNLTEIQLNEGLELLGKYALSSCYALEHVDIPSSLTVLEENTFYFCSSLKSVTVASSMQKISYGAFYFCSALKTVTYSGSPHQWKKIVIEEQNTPLENAEFEYTGPYTESTAEFSENSCMINISPINIPSGKKITAAGFSADGRLSDIQEALNNTSEIRITLNGDIEAVKIFVWDDLTPFVSVPETIKRSIAK